MTKPCNVPGCPNDAIDRWLTGWRCALHTPCASAGLPEPPKPDPALTLVGLREAAGRAHVASPVVASQLHDDRAVASGKRRASPHQIADARMRIAAEDKAAVEAPAPEPVLVDLFDGSLP